MHPQVVVPRSGSEVEALANLRTIVSSNPPNLVLKASVDMLRQSFESYNWIGIYLVKENNLVLAAYAGDGETEHVKIPIGHGICGLAAKEGETIIVPDVSKDPRYLMCFPSTRSEIVVPIKSGTKVYGEIDIDSDQLSAFNRDDKSFLERAASILVVFLEDHYSTLLAKL